jgi:ATP-dependent DNA helicase DinG
LRLFLDAEIEDDVVRWFECRGRGYMLRISPLDVAERFEAHRQAPETAWIFTSATLTVAGSFAHFRARLGLEDGRELLLTSPFDYARNALLYLPADLPAVDDAGYTRAVVEAALPVLRVSRGRAFLLFTSHRALRQAAAALHGRIDHPLLVQGEMARSQLIERFRQLGNAVLLGTASFWEGVDVRGPALSVVIIDRLPFAAPGDPVLAARLEAIKRRGENPFIAYQLPQAVITLKQGVGRLIRDRNDCGVMMLCDPRLSRRAYGKVFLNSLPPMRRTRSLDEVERFLAELAAVA